MAEVGAPPKVSGPRRRALKAVRSLFSPLLPDDYLELINPLWSTQELRGRIERIEREAGNAVTVVIKPGYEWDGHRPGQYLRVGVVVDGVHHWRAYSLTSDPGRPDGTISITPKLVEAGKVSPHLVRHARPGAIVRLGGVEGTFVLPDPLPDLLPGPVPERRPRDTGSIRQVEPRGLRPVPIPLVEPRGPKPVPMPLVAPRDRDSPLVLPPR